MPVGYYDARVRELRLVGEGNLWPGTAENAFICFPLRPFAFNASYYLEPVPGVRLVVSVARSN